MPRYSRDAFEFAAIGMALVDLQGRWIRVNRALTSILGYSREELLATTFQAITHPDVLEADLAQVRRLVAGRGDEYSMTKRYFHRSGREVRARLSVSVVRDAVGAPEYFIAQIQDVTDEQRTADALAETTRLLRGVIHASPAAIIVADGAGKVRIWNRAAEVAFGWRASEVMGHPLPAIIRDSQSTPVDLSQAVSRGTALESRAEGVHRDGKRIPVFLTASPLQEENYGGGFVAIVQDMTEWERLQADLRQAQSLDVLGQLTAGIAHDFNNLLAAVRGHVDLLMDSRLREDQQPDLAEIARAVDRGAALTRQLLVFTRRQITRRITTDLRRVVSGVMRLLERLLVPGVSLDTRVEVTEAAWVAADVGQVEQALVNLVVNARDAMADGGTVRVCLRQESLRDGRRGTLGAVPPGNYAIVAVEDSGPGIAPDVLPRVIEPFFSTKAELGHTGLGLATVLGIATNHGGHFTLDTAPGKGTIASLYLPLASTPADTDSNESTGPVAAVNTPSEILVVDDEDGLRRVIARFLRRRGLIVHEATSGEDALNQLRGNNRIRLAVSDVRMPGMSGLQLAQLAANEFPEVRFILTSGYSDSEVSSGGGVPHCDFLSKPYELEELLRLVQKSETR